MSPLVSIIIPTYNYARYLRHAIDSALNQSYSNIEVIVVDDGSTDDTQQLLAEYGEKIRNVLQVNQGASAARNRGIREACGEYIAFLDADDTYRKDNITEKVNFLREHRQYAWCYSNWAWVDADGVVYRLGSDHVHTLAHLKADGDVLSLTLQGYELQTNMFLFSRAVIESVGGFDERMAVLEDHDLFIRASAEFPLGYIDKILCDIFQHPGSLGKGSTKQTGYFCRWLLNRKLAKMFPEQIRKISKKWNDQLSDVYRNLAELALANGYPARARVLCRASMARKLWQPGIVLLCWRIRSAHEKRQ